MSDTPKRIKVGLLDNNPDNKLEEDCPWYVNSEEHYNCFWVYVLVKSEIDGSMKELTQSEMAELLGCSTTKIHFLLKEATTALTEILNNKKSELALLDESSLDLVPFLSSSKLKIP